MLSPQSGPSIIPTTVLTRRTLPAENFTAGRAGHRPGWIVIHTTDGTARGALGWFANPDSGVSAHYLVELDGSVTQLVAEEDAAHHAGAGPAELAGRFPTPEPNLHTVGIEFEDGGDPLGVDRPAAQYEAGAALIAEVARRWAIPLDAEHVLGHRELNPHKTCPGNLDLERLLDLARTAGAEPAALAPEEAERPLLAVLLPARNAEDDLPGYLDSVSGFADLVIALDDGSTDRTPELLAGEAAVKRVLTNPPRDAYSGWDDAENRRRLLEAAAEFEPRWILWLDADERIDADDGAALREFCEGDALTGLAYGLELHRMWGERIADVTWVYRLFAFAPGLELPDRRLHFNPVPTSIPKDAWVRTSIRVRHLDSPGRLAERREKYAQVDPVGAFERRPARLLEEPGEELTDWAPRDPHLPVLRVDGTRPGDGPDADGGEDRPLLVCLLPVRNGAADLPGHLESVAQFADAVIALDDGSTDSTAEILDASDIVEAVLRNPRRETYEGWDDAGNRQRLLDAAAELRPRWVLWLDADERIDADDGAALRRFLAGGADPEAAFGMRVYRMIGDEQHFDEAGLWAYRLFAWRPGLRLPEDRLHLVPVPEDIPRDRWRRTTFRIKHLAGLTDERRRARFAKYTEADPGNRFQGDYTNLLRREAVVRPWVRRPPDLPALADPLGRGASAEVDLSILDPTGPLLSAIVISRDDEETIERSVRSVVEQECPDPFEVIVVVSGTDGTADVVREKFPGVRLIRLEGEALPGRARNAGLAVARGDFISFPGSHVELPPGSLAARVRAHELGYAMVTGTVLNGTLTCAGWASYFLDHGQVLPARPSTELGAAPAHCSYVREFLEEVGGFPEDLRVGEDTIVNRELWRRGRPAFRAQDVRLYHRSPCRDVATLVRHHFRRGRGMGRILVDDHRDGRRLLRRAALKAYLLRYLPARVRRLDGQVADWGGALRPVYRRVRPLVIAGSAAALAGIWVEILRPARGKLGVLLGDQHRDRSELEVPRADAAGGGVSSGRRESSTSARG